MCEKSERYWRCNIMYVENVSITFFRIILQYLTPFYCMTMKWTFSKHVLINLCKNRHSITNISAQFYSANRRLAQTKFCSSNSIAISVNISNLQINSNRSVRKRYHLLKWKDTYCSSNKSNFSLTVQSWQCWQYRRTQETNKFNMKKLSLHVVGIEHGISCFLLWYLLD